MKKYLLMLMLTFTLSILAINSTEKVFAKNPVKTHGRLKVKGVNLVDKKGKKFRLKGFSTHGINWFENYVNKEAFGNLKKMGINCIRLAMYTSDYNGYCSGGNN